MHLILKEKSNIIELSFLRRQIYDPSFHHKRTTPTVCLRRFLHDRHADIGLFIAQSLGADHAFPLARLRPSSLGDDERQLRSLLSVGLPIRDSVTASAHRGCAAQKQNEVPSTTGRYPRVFGPHLFRQYHRQYSSSA